MTVQTPTPFPVANRAQPQGPADQIGFGQINHGQINHGQINHGQISFDRRELGAILAIYGRMVAAGEWRDYGISCLTEAAVFCIFRRTAENPLYRIEKRPRLRARQGMFALIGAEGQVLKRGHELAPVLHALERRTIRAVD